MKNILSRDFNVLSMAVGAVIVSASALAQGNASSELSLEEIVVTAQKRTQTLSDVPISVSAVSGEKLLKSGIADLTDLSAYVPNFQKAELALGSVISIRGISSGANQGFEQSVVQYVDDVALGRAPLARAPFMDLARIEVLRGPQNVLFGKNSIGGALSLTTNGPTDDFEGSVNVEFEPEYDTKMTQLILSGPLTDTVQGRLALRYYEDDGYFKNNVSSDEESNRKDLTGRLMLNWDASDRLAVTLKYEPPIAIS